MLAVDEALERALKQKYSEAEIQQFFSGRANRGQILLIYQRENGDRTAGLPSSRHMYYAQQGWIAVGIAALTDDPPPAQRLAVSPSASTSRKK